MTKTRTPAHKRLREIPEVFTTHTLSAMLGTDSRATSVYLNRWRKEGLISSLGKRAGVHFNLVRNPSAEEELRLEAIRLVFPGAVIAGASAVHAAGWTTQIPSALEIMIPPRASTPEIEGVDVATRPVAWFREARKRPQRTGAVPTVDPAFALADLWHRNVWRPDEDDLEWDMIPPERLRAAFRLFGRDIPEEWQEAIGEMQGTDRDPDDGGPDP